MILKNVTEGPKVLNTLAGPVTVPAGGVADVELSEGEHLSMLATEWFEEAEAKHPLDHDGDGKPGGSLPRRRKSAA